jgi:hypothetical protein
MWVSWRRGRLVRIIVNGWGARSAAESVGTLPIGGGTLVGLTFVVLVVVAFGVVVLGLGLVLERLARRRRVGTPPEP